MRGFDTIYERRRQRGHFHLIHRHKQQLTNEHISSTRIYPHVWANLISNVTSQVRVQVLTNALHTGIPMSCVQSQCNSLTHVHHTSSSARAQLIHRCVWVELLHVRNDSDSAPKAKVSSRILSFVKISTRHGVSPWGVKGQKYSMRKKIYGVGPVHPNQNDHHMSKHLPPSWP